MPESEEKKKDKKRTRPKSVPEPAYPGPVPISHMEEAEPSVPEPGSGLIRGTTKFIKNDRVSNSHTNTFNFLLLP